MQICFFNVLDTETMGCIETINNKLKMYSKLRLYTICLFYYIHNRAAGILMPKAVLI